MNQRERLERALPKGVTIAEGSIMPREQYRGGRASALWKYDVTLDADAGTEFVDGVSQAGSDSTHLEERNIQTEEGAWNNLITRVSMLETQEA